MRALFSTSLTIFALIVAGCTFSDPDIDIAPPPMSGLWSFQITVADLQGTRCPTAGATGFSTQGDAELFVNESGELAMMSIDGQQLVFHRQPGDGSLFKTGTRLFPVSGRGPGSVYFDFVAQTPDTISGAIHWDNKDDCLGNYPFVMELIEPELPGAPDISPYTLAEGPWGIEIEDMLDDCGAGDIAGFTGLPDTLDLSYVEDLDTGAPILTEFYADSLGVIFEQIPDTNIYSQTGGPFDLGSPVDQAGDLLLDYENQTFEGTFEIHAGYDGAATGQLYISDGSCGMVVDLSFTRL